MLFDLLNEIDEMECDNDNRHSNIDKESMMTESFDLDNLIDDEDD